MNFFEAAIEAQDTIRTAANDDAAGCRSRASAALLYWQTVIGDDKGSPAPAAEVDACNKAITALRELRDAVRTAAWENDKYRTLCRLYRK